MFDITPFHSYYSHWGSNIDMSVLNLWLMIAGYVTYIPVFYIVKIDFMNIIPFF